MFFHIYLSSKIYYTTVMHLNYLRELYEEISLPIIKSPSNNYYILSSYFIQNLKKAADGLNQNDRQSLIKGDFNKDIIDHYEEGYPVLVESLREGRDYHIIAEPTFQMLMNHFSGTPLLRQWSNVIGRTLIYENRLQYATFTRQHYLHQQTEIIIHHHYFLPSATCTNIEEVLRQKHSPLSLYPHNSVELWLSKQPFPKDYKLLIEAVSRTQTIFPTDFLLLDPQLFKITRKFKNPFFLLQIYEQDYFLPRKSHNCQQHSQKKAIYCCLCLHQRTYRCSQLCFKSDKKHMARCIYMSLVDQVESQKKIQKGNGLAGLYNESNMCYFNTALQCLGHTQLLNRYFVERNLKKELNYWNKDGTFGQIAVLYGSFIRNLWTKREKQDLKINMPLFQSIGRWNPVYAKKNQQDAHEFIVGLLDWLKQDLNRNQDRSCYRQLQQLSSQTQILASSQKNLCQRSDSIIQDLFCSLLRSSIVCLKCEKTSTTFDTCLTVQLPVATPQRKEIFPIEVKIFYHELNLYQIYKLSMMLLLNQPLGEVKKRIRAEFPEGKSFEIGLFVVTMNRGFRAVKQTRQMMNLQSDQIVYCVEKYRIGIQGFVETQLIFQQEDTTFPGIFRNSIFQRPLYLATKMVSNQIYSRILQYIFQRVNKSNIINFHTFLAKNKENGTFPFTISIKYIKNGMDYQQIVTLGDNNSHQIQIQAGYQIIVKLKNHKDLEYKRLISFKHKSQKFPPSSKTFKSSQSKLEDCIEAFCKKQILSGWSCPGCSSNKAATKTISFQKLPKIFILSLNRFKKDYSSIQEGIFHKNQTFVKYPEELQIKSQENHIYKYRLYALANHIKLGQGRQDVNQMNGHYHAYVRVDKAWYKFDDDIILPIDEYRAFKSQQAYIFFYYLLS